LGGNEEDLVCSWEVEGEQSVRLRLAKAEFGEPETRTHRMVEAWLEAKGAARSDESLSIARKALANSKFATRLSAIAIVLSVVVAAQRFVEWYSR
jgi:hypothetical protein